MREGVASGVGFVGLEQLLAILVCGQELNWSGDVEREERNPTLLLSVSCTGVFFARILRCGLSLFVSNARNGDFGA